LNKNILSFNKVGWFQNYILERAGDRDEEIIEHIQGLLRVTRNGLKISVDSYWEITIQERNSIFTV